MELVDKFDNKRRPLGKVTERRNHIPNEYRQSVHVWIVNDNNEFLFQKRHPSKLNNPNRWSIHGGGVDQGETTLEAAIRECQEEIGITFTEDDLEFLVGYRTNHTFTDVYLAKKNIPLDAITMQETEVSDVKYVPYEEVLDFVNNDQFASNIKPYCSFFLNLYKRSHLDEQ